MISVGKDENLARCCPSREPGDDEVSSSMSMTAVGHGAETNSEDGA